MIFFARYEASQYVSRYIETEHLLLGLLGEDRALAQLILPTSSIDAIRQSQREPRKCNPSDLRMVLVLYDAHPGWLVASAHLAHLEPGGANAKRNPE